MVPPTMGAVYGKKRMNFRPFFDSLKVLTLFMHVSLLAEIVDEVSSKPTRASYPD
jgi:hypothetical protein